MQARVSKAVFPAAGLGTRFLPATKAQPKEMLPIVDKPIIQYGLEEALHSGIQNIIIVTGRGKTAIEDHFDVSFELENLLESRAKKDLLNIVRSISDMINVSYVRQNEALGRSCRAAGLGTGGQRTVFGGACRRYDRGRDALPAPVAGRL
jgi:UTP--glucose-1-phosphate uridylyltransferase